MHTLGAELGPELREMPADSGPTRVGYGDAKAPSPLPTTYRRQ